MNADHSTVIVDEIFSMLEAAKSSVVPGSICQAVVSAIQNVPSNVKQSSVGGSSGSAYMTFPLSPIVKNCCLDKTYLNLEFDINMHMTATLSSSSDKDFIAPIYIGFRDSFGLFNQVQFLIENSCIWQTVYQREESVNAYNSLPETEIRGNPQYSSIEKMRLGSKSPMRRVLVKFTSSGSDTTAKTCETKIHFKVTVDINRLSPIFSNLSFTTPHMGNLRLKVFMQEIEKAMFFCPDYSWFPQNAGITGIATTATPIGGTPGDTATHKQVDDALATLASTATVVTPQPNQYWSFYALNNYWNTDISKNMIPCYAYNATTKLPVLLENFKFTNPTDGSNFMTFADSGIAEIVQTCFDIFDDDYKRLTDHFMSMGSVIIPTQTWSTNVFNNSEIPTGSQYNSSMIGNVGGYSIDLISVWAHSNKAPCSFSKEFFTMFQLLLDGRPINAIPYGFEDDKFLTDTTQAIIDTDHEEINKDYVDSIAFLNLTDDDKYVDATPNAMYGVSGTGVGSSIHKGFLSNPNTFAAYFSTNLPNCFRSGACNLETTNRQAILRFNTSMATDKLETDRDKFPHFFNHTNNPGGTTVGFSCLCDCVIVLNMDERGTCYDGTLSWAAPYQ